jgi:hypothetical protein
MSAQNVSIVTSVMTSVVEIERNPKIKACHDVRQEGRACLVCWDLLISFYFYNRCHDARYNGHILCARVARVIQILLNQCDSIMYGFTTQKYETFLYIYK